MKSFLQISSRVMPIAAAVLLCGCGGATAYRALDAQVGRPLAEWVREFGEPQRSADGREVSWNWETSRVVGGHRGTPTAQVSSTPSGPVTTVVPGEYIPPRLVRYGCRLTASLNDGGMVTAWQAEGDGCHDLLNYPELRSAPRSTGP